jgi:hypothetical protein
MCKPNVSIKRLVLWEYSFMDLIERVEQQRKKLGMTKAAIARKLNTGPNTR